MESKTHGGPWALHGPPLCKHLDAKMQSLARMDMTVIEDYFYMAIMGGKWIGWN